MAAGASMGRGALGLTVVCLGAGFALGFLSAPENTGTTRSAALRASASALPPPAHSVITGDMSAPAPAAAAVPAEAKNAPAEQAKTSLKPAPDSPKKSLNYALAANGATVSGGQHPELLIDGNHAQYDGANGYAQTARARTWNAGAGRCCSCRRKTCGACG